MHAFSPAGPNAAAAADMVRRMMTRPGLRAVWSLLVAGTLSLSCTSDRGSPSTDPGAGGGRPAGAKLDPSGAIAAGVGHTCVIRSQGKVSCWGTNTDGQLGDGTSIDRSLPVAVPGLGGIVELALGRGHSCARRSSGSVVCWGANARGQLGSGNDYPSKKPVAVRGLSDAIAIASGDDHTCALRKTGAVVCWGANADGQLGNLTRKSWNEPAPIRGLVDATAIAAGARHSCALRKTGGVICWGANESGQLGDGSTQGHERPSAVADLQGVREIGAGGSRTCAATGAGLYCWGEVELGANEGKAVPRPRKVAELGSDAVVELELGPAHACITTAAKRGRCWGHNRDGRVGDGSFDDRGRPVEVGVPEVDGFALGARHTCARAPSGMVSCWGDDAGGALGQGEPEEASAREGVAKVLDLRDAVDLAAGDAFSCAVRKTGEVVCWGNNELGQLGDASGVDARARPMPVAKIDDAVAIAAGPEQACAVRKTGDVECWGNNERGQLGRPAGAPQVRPAPVPKLDDAVDVSIGFAHGCAVRRTGEVYCWGDDSEGQLGDGAGERGGRVAGLGDATAIVSGRAHTCALRRAGAIACWGANNLGQLGNSAGAAELKTPAEYPVMVTKVSDASEVAVGPDHGCARLRTGKAVCWGNNEASQLGSGTASNVWTSRVPVRDLAKVSALAISPVHACAAMGQRVACWGDNAAGQGGYPGATAPTPRVGVTGLEVASLALGREHSCARLRGGEVACWGSNTHGQLGDGGRMLSATPLEVLGL